MLGLHQRDQLDGFQRHLLEMLDNIERRITDMALDLTNLSTQASRLTADVDKLIAAGSDPTAQAAVDAVAKTLSDAADKADAALTPVIPVPPVVPAA